MHKTHPYDVRGILFPSLPASKNDLGLPGKVTIACLRAKNKSVRLHVMCEVQDVDRDNTVQVPVNCHTWHILQGLWVWVHLQQLGNMNLYTMQKCKVFTWPAVLGVIFTPPPPPPPPPQKRILAS